MAWSIAITAFTIWWLLLMWLIIVIIHYKLIQWNFISLEFKLLSRILLWRIFSESFSNTWRHRINVLRLFRCQVSGFLSQIGLTTFSCHFNLTNMISYNDCWIIVTICSANGFFSKTIFILLVFCQQNKPIIMIFIITNVRWCSIILSGRLNLTLNKIRQFISKFLWGSSQK